MIILQKNIRYFGVQSVLACDGRCDKAWGINRRPRLYFQESLVEPRALTKDEEPRNDDDYVYVGDNELPTAPADPGTYEADEAKPSAVPLIDPSRMNKWCARECERSKIVPAGESISIALPNLETPRPNIPRREIK